MLLNRGRFVKNPRRVYFVNVPKCGNFIFQNLFIMTVEKYLKGKIGEKVSIKMIDEIKRLQNPMNFINKDLDKHIESKILFWAGQNIYTADVLNEIESNYPALKNVSSKRLIYAIRCKCLELDYTFSAIKNPKRGFFIKIVV